MVEEMVRDDSRCVARSIAACESAASAVVRLGHRPGESPENCAHTRVEAALATAGSAAAPAAHAWLTLRWRRPVAGPPTHE